MRCIYNEGENFLGSGTNTGKLGKWSLFTSTNYHGPVLLSDASANVQGFHQLGSRWENVGILQQMF